MSIVRSLVALAAAVTALAVLAVLPTAGPELVSAPGDLVAWWELHGTAAAAVGLLHLMALAGFLWVTAVLATIVVAQALRLPAAALAVARLAPGSLRRSLMVGVAVGTLAMPTTAVAQEPIVIVDVGSEPAPASSPIVLTDLGEAPSVGPAAEPAVTVDPTESARPSAFSEGFRASIATATPDAWLVEPGDSLWTIAAEVVGAHTDGGRDEASVARYWRSLMAANADMLGDPDLIHPGQVLHLPSVTTAGS